MENRVYDERYYLDENNTHERDFLLNEQKFWNIREIYNNILFSSLIKDFDSYMIFVRSLVDEISPNMDELSKINTIMYLLTNGIFSYDGKLKSITPIKDIICSKLSLNIIEGNGCCRHFASFINEIMPTSTKLTCVGEVDNPFSREANHVINKIIYDGNIYGFDAYNDGVLFDFVSDFEMNAIDMEFDDVLYYKPYAEVMFYKRSFEEVKFFLEQIKNNGINKITREEAKEISLNALVNIRSNKDLISDFRSDTKVLLESINEQIKEIRIKQ